MGQTCLPPSPASATQPSTGTQWTARVTSLWLLQQLICNIYHCVILKQQSHAIHILYPPTVASSPTQVERWLWKKLLGRTSTKGATPTACAPCLFLNGGSRFSSQVLIWQKTVWSAVAQTSLPTNNCLRCVSEGKPKKGVIYPSTLDFVPSRPTYVKTSERRQHFKGIWVDSWMNLVEIVLFLYI